MLDKKKTRNKTIAPVNDDDKYFQYVATFALSYEEIGKYLERISKIKPFINKLSIRKDYECRLKYIDVKNDLILCKCLCCKRNYQNKLMKT